MQLAIDIALSLIYFGLFLLLCAWAWRFWTMYVNQQHLNGIKWILLEIKLPREIFKSPFAAEVALSSLLQTGGVGTRWHRLFQGNLPTYASVEIASVEGIIHFYVRIQEKYRPLVEANLYAQYPGIEIVEADDYTKLIRYHHLSKDTSIYGARFKLTRSWKPYNVKTGKPYDDPDKKGKPYEMPADFFPLKTYVDYELNKNPKEEHKIDPIAPMLEFMGAIGKGEHFWFQIIMTDEGNYNGKKMPEFFVNKVQHIHVTLKQMADTYKKELRILGFNPKGDPVKNEYGSAMQRQMGRDEDGNPIMMDVTYGEDVIETKREMELTADDKAEIEAINRKLSKPIALSVIRMIYVAKKDAYDYRKLFNIVSWQKPFNGANSLAPSTTDPYDFPWQNFQGRRVPWRGEEMFEAYVEREGFFPHIPSRDWLDKWEDSMFWSSSMKTRKVFRMLVEGFLYPFDHPHPEDVSALNLEEIATMWHLPGTVVTTPTLPRIDSAKGVAPVNLPQ